MWYGSVHNIVPGRGLLRVENTGTTACTTVANKGLPFPPLFVELL